MCEGTKKKHVHLRVAMEDAKSDHLKAMAEIAAELAKKLADDLADFVGLAGEWGKDREAKKRLCSQRDCAVVLAKRIVSIHDAYLNEPGMSILPFVREGGRA